MKIDRVILSTCIVLSMSACSTEPGETTAMGAVAGGAFGAGMGAIIGSTTGDAGAGLALGTVAGAGTGAAIGNVFEAQEKIIRTQDEAMTRQGRQIAEQQSQIEELRRMGQDQVAYGNSGSTYNALDNALANSKVTTNSLNTYGNSTGSFGTTNTTIVRSETPSAQELKQRRLNATSSTTTYNNTWVANNTATTTYGATNTWAKSGASNSVNANNTVTAPTTTLAKNEAVVPSFVKDTVVEVKQDTVKENEAKGSYNWNKVDENSVLKGARTDSLAIMPDDASENDCEAANSEAQSAREASSLADRLFHYRRALRLCPNSASLHNSMGEVYISLRRNGDAEAEFKQALELDANYSAARSNLESLRQASSKNY